MLVQSIRPSGLSLGVQWVLIFISLTLPSIPAKLLFSAALLNGRVVVIGPKTIAFGVLWIVLGVATIIVRWIRSRQPNEWQTDSVYIGYLSLCSIPVLLSGTWLYSAPYIHSGALRIFAVSSIIPLCFNLVWDLALRRLSSKFTRTELILPGASAVVTLLLCEFVSGFFLMNHAAKDVLVVNSPDRSYWYWVRKMTPDGTNQANSFGFLEPEPEKNFSGTRVLLVGDSIPAAERPVNFAKVAEAHNEQEAGRDGRIDILNASISAYSLEQIKRYYIEKLEGLSHDLLIVGFYVDDVNRELSYVKRNILYSPAWPEWMQDIYYSCYFCRQLLTWNDFTKSTFQITRTIKTYEKAFPNALKALEELRLAAKRRGAKFSVINIPLIDWPDVLYQVSSYKYVDINRQLEEWCRKRNVAYHDFLPALIGKDIRRLRISDTDYHLNDLGHQVVGAELASFLRSLIRAGYLETTASDGGPRTRLIEH